MSQPAGSPAGRRRVAGRQPAHGIRGVHHLGESPAVGASPRVHHDRPEAFRDTPSAASSVIRTGTTAVRVDRAAIEKGAGS
jgi:hypothetical protein